MTLSLIVFLKRHVLKCVCVCFPFDCYMKQEHSVLATDWWYRLPLVLQGWFLEVVGVLHSHKEIIDDRRISISHSG